MLQMRRGKGSRPYRYLCAKLDLKLHLLLACYNICWLVLLLLCKAVVTEPLLQAKIAEKAAREKEAEERWQREKEAALRFEEAAAKKFMALMSEAANNLPPTPFDDDDLDDLDMFM